MTVTEFRSSLQFDAPPVNVSPLLTAMWYDARGNWKKAHEICQEIDTPDGAWVHAYLHRKEGDQSNASYWYRHAGAKVPSVSLDEEWNIIVSQLIDRA
jgi:hypothetical protein